MAGTGCIGYRSFLTVLRHVSWNNLSDPTPGTDATLSFGELGDSSGSLNTIYFLIISNSHYQVTKLYHFYPILMHLILLSSSVQLCWLIRYALNIATISCGILTGISGYTVSHICSFRSFLKSQVVVWCWVFLPCVTYVRTKSVVKSEHINILLVGPFFTLDLWFCSIFFSLSTIYCTCYKLRKNYR